MTGGLELQSAEEKGDPLLQGRQNYENLLPLVQKLSTPSAAHLNIRSQIQNKQASAQKDQHFDLYRKQPLRPSGAVYSFNSKNMIFYFVHIAVYTIDLKSSFS